MQGGQYNDVKKEAGPTWVGHPGSTVAGEKEQHPGFGSTGAVRRSRSGAGQEVQIRIRNRGIGSTGNGSTEGGLLIGQRQKVCG